MNDLTWFDIRSGFLKFGKDRAIRVDFVAGHAGQDKPQLQPFEVMLPLQLPVDGDEDVKLILRISQQGTVLAAAPTGFADGFDGMPRKGRLDADVHTLV